MSERDRLKDVAKLAKPATGNRIYFDSEVSGFGCRVTAGGARSFILDYRNRAGRQRRYTIGSVGDWTVGAARKEAKDLRRQIDGGGDPMGQRRADRDAPAVTDLCERFKSEHLPKKRPATERDYKAIIEKLIKPRMGTLKVADVTFADVDALHRKITKSGATYQANRCVAVLSKMFSLAIKWGMRPDNPAKGIERNHEDRRERYLSDDEISRLGPVLDKCDDRQGATIIGLLLLTGARSGEVRSMRWQEIDLKGVWSKPSSSTKQKKAHRVPLNAPALALLRKLREEADKSAIYVFPGDGKAGHRAEIKKTWASVCKAAKIKDCRIHDLRHSYASILASSGYSLPTIGKLLGHSNPITTSRYAHLADDPLKAATEKVGEVVSQAK